MPDTMPALFLGHGNPMNALASNPFTAAWANLGAELPRPKAILCISAHWYVPGAALTVNTSPRTIHDFGGFPQELFRVQYPAPGDPQLAARVRDLLAPLPVDLSQDWGLDHGAWSVLAHVYPAADIPVVQLSIDRTRTAAYHYDIGRRIAPLREEGVLILGSGNVVHNLGAISWDPAGPAYDWAGRFEAEAKHRLLAGEHDALVGFNALGRDAELSIPTPDHYLPLLYTIGASLPGEAVSFPVEGVVHGSISMLGVQVGQPATP